ncbi:hypothetical protein F5B18DRAFT_655126 [Nemania serpens]|nr:hypothetical protein F5B18DRAFT_655126 [Nemania serpens]
MSNQGPRAGGKHRNLSGPWRRNTAAPTRKAQPSTPVQNSSNYRGDINNPCNQSANIPDSENCATWWTNLPADCTYEMLFDSIRSVGAVSHAVINPPVGMHGTAAAKIEFFERASVDRLMAQAKNGHIRGHMRVGGRIPHITLNRIKVSACSNVVPDNMGNDGRGTRVLQVIGDPKVVQRDRLETILASPPNKVIYGLERARGFGKPDGSYCVEFRFASYVVQAVRARDAFMAQKRKSDLSEEVMALWKDVICVFAPDPCE